MGIGLDLLFSFESNMYFFLIAYPILGAGIKYIDAAYDEQVFNKNIAIIFAPVIGILWAFTMLINNISTTILLAVILAVLIKGKIDNYAHLFGLLTITAISVFVIIFINGNGIMLLPLILLTSAGMIDEVGNDVIFYNKKFTKNKFRYQFLVYFFGRRYLMKFFLLYISLFGLFPFYFLISFILFDEAYIIMDLYAQSKLN